MANEAVKVEGTYANAVRRTVANAPAITKGTLCKLLTPNTASGAATSGAACAGIAADDKVAADGATDLAFWTEGCFDILCSGAIVCGEPVRMAGFNAVAAINGTPSDTSGAMCLGYAEETGADGNVIRIRLKL